MLVVDLNLMRRASFGHEYVTRSHVDRQSVWVDQVAVASTILSDDAPEGSVLVKNLNPMVVCISNKNLVQVVDGESTWLSKLTRLAAVFTELTMILHFGPRRKNWASVRDNCLQR